MLASNFSTGDVVALRSYAVPGLGASTQDRGCALHLVLPVTVLNLLNIAGFHSRLLRSSMLEVLEVRLCTLRRAKTYAGFCWWVKHALRNAFVPITIIVYTIPTIFERRTDHESLNYKGIELLFIQALDQRDWRSLRPF